MKMQKC